MNIYEEQKQLKIEKDNTKRKIKKITEECINLKKIIKNYQLLKNRNNDDYCQVPRQKVTLLKTIVNDIKNYPITNLEVLFVTAIFSFFGIKAILLPLKVVPNLMFISATFITINIGRFVLMYNNSKKERKQPYQIKEIKENRFLSLYETEIEKAEKELQMKQEKKELYLKRLNLISEKLITNDEKINVQKNEQYPKEQGSTKKLVKKQGSVKDGA